MADIKVFKLSSGEEVICNILSESDDAYIADRPLVIATAPQDGQLHIALIPFTISNQTGSVRIYKDSIVAQPLTISEDLEKGYLKQTTRILLA